MPIQTGILPAGSTLTVDYSIGETAIISYQDGDIGVVDNGQTKTTDRTIGPFSNDVAYSIDYTGWPKVFTTAAGGSITTISLPLPDTASLGVGDVVNDGQRLLKKTPAGMVIDGVSTVKKNVQVDRLYGVGSTIGSTAVTGMLLRECPADFDAVRITVVSPTATNGSALKFTVAPSATFNKKGPVDSSGTRIGETVVTWGSTDAADTRNPGGGAVTVTPSGASGATASTDYVLSRIRSDIIPLQSIARSDVVGGKPILVIKGYGANLPAEQNVEHAVGTTNDIQSALGYQEFSGYRTGDYSVSDPAYNAGIADSGGYYTQNGRLTVEVEFFLRGKRCINIGITGDSTDQGWVDSTAVPQFGGNINGYMRRVVNSMRQSGMAVGYSVFAQAGQRNFVSYNNALPAVLSGQLTHLIIRPFSVNDRNTGTTAAVANACLQRTTQLVQACIAKGVVPIILRPFAFGVSDTVQMPLIEKYISDFSASGGLVMDFTSVMNDSDGYNLKPAWLTVNSGGAIVDKIHPNNAAHQAAADYIINNLLWLFS